MKNVYIPKGETVSYDMLSTENLVVKGCLIVDGGLKAKHISGNGAIHAGNISADTIKIAEVEAAFIACESLVAKRVSTAEIHASESIAVSCYLEADFVETGKLTACMTQVAEIDAREVINLPNKKRSLFGILLASALRTRWFSFCAPKYNAQAPKPDDAVEEEVLEFATTAGSEPIEDFELKRIISMFKLCRNEGFTLKLVPGTPEENAQPFQTEPLSVVPKAA